MRRWVVAVAVATGLVPVLKAQGTTITASDRVFTPREVEIVPGGSVRLDNSGGIHNFKFADGSYPANPTEDTDPVWDDLSRTFAAAGDYAFVCAAHPEMTGVVHVRDPAATATPTPTATPDPQPQPGSAPPEVRELELAATRFCLRCAVRVRIDLSQPATVTGTLQRRGRRFGRVRFGTVGAGPRTLRFRRTAAGRKLVAGRYVLALRVGGEPQPALRFRVR
ncbi:MAG TPA: plastocyanin/azurin family copper-binding protein [Solirubrobacteraceae bacterium]|nr:plastocyanin/azurin family copper-binding protein [Solirubrobacteraceae bacterium]